MAIISGITIYPVKGLRGIHLKASSVESMGLKDDRRFMLVDNKGAFLSQRTHPKMARIDIEIQGKNITASFEKESISFSKDPKTDELIKTKVWKHEIESYLVHPNASEWFSNVLNSSVRLVKIPGPKSRIKTFDPSPGQSPLSFADGYPILIAGSASLNFLNSKLLDSISMDRFRPNIVVETMTPHEEDEYYRFNVGTSRFQGIKPCVRCQVITIDQNTAEKGVEPLKTLATYRRNGKGVCFGVNVIVLQEGSVKLGDELVFS